MRSRTAFQRTVSIVESRLEQLRSGTGSVSNRAEEQPCFGAVQLFPILFNMWLLLVSSKDCQKEIDFLYVVEMNS